MLAKLLDLIWPRPCEVCGRPADRPGRHLCSDCLNRLPFLPTTGLCRRCGRAAIGFDGEYLCADCQAHRPAFDRACSVWEFDREARQMVLDYKFRRHLWLVPDFVDMLEARARTHFDCAAIDRVLAVPATIAHRIDRGYNPCALLARQLARRIERPFAMPLRRVGHPQRQAGLDEAARRANVVGTFAVRHPLAAETILLIDDVMTTGATLSEAARTLKNAGAQRVWALSLVRSLRQV